MVALALAVTLVAVLGWRHWQIGQQQDALIKQLQASAEYVVLDARRDGNKLHLQLLSRFGAPPPQQMLDLSAARNIELSIHTTPVSMNPEDALLPYLEQRYGLGPQVSLQLQGDSLLLAGEMTLQQLQQIRSDRRVNQLVDQLDERAVTLLPAPDQRAVDEARFRALVDQLQRTRFMFAENSADLAETEIAKAATALAQLRTLIELGQNLGISGLQIVITGFADTTGPDALNSRLSRDRALRLSGFFADNRIDEALLVSLGVGSLNAGNLPSLHKRVVAMQILYAPAAPFVAAGESGT
jgi:outer membrane protein OmpA-like peptidoglycan-associated protein